MRKNLICFLLLFSGCFGSETVSRKIGIDDSMRVNPGDVVRIELKFYPHLNQRIVVPIRGRAIIAGLGEIQFAGKTRFELRKQLGKLYQERLSSPIFQLKIEPRTSFTVYIGGKVKAPGNLSFESRISVARGLLTAGGFIGSAHEYEVHIFRNGFDGSPQKYMIDLKNVKSSHLITDFMLEPGDVVMVLQGKVTPKGVEI